MADTSIGGRRDDIGRRNATRGGRIADRIDVVTAVCVYPYHMGVRQLECGRGRLAIDQQQETGSSDLEQERDEVAALEACHKAYEEGKVAVFFGYRPGLVKKSLHRADVVGPTPERVCLPEKTGVYQIQGLDRRVNVGRHPGPRLAKLLCHCLRGQDMLCLFSIQKAVAAPENVGPHQWSTKMLGRIGGCITAAKGGNCRQLHHSRRGGI
jgi:hypothetical protein